MKNKILLLLMCIGFAVNAQNSCSYPFSLCTNTVFPSMLNSSTAVGPSYGCITTQSNQTWLYVKITNSGSLNYRISLPGDNADFACWGPFLSMNNVCSQLTATNVIDCGYSSSVTETLTIPNGIVGEYYMILVASYGNQAGNIEFQSLPGTGSPCSYYEGISGRVYHDLNADCLYDATDDYLRNIPVKEYDHAGNFLGLSYQSYMGNYRIPYKFYNDTGSYTVKIDTNNVPYTAQCIYPGPDSTVALTTAAPGDTNVNFSMTCKPGFDLSVHSIFRSGWVFPGRTHTVRITAGDLIRQYYNLGCDTHVGGQVTVSFGGPVTYLSTLSTIQPTAVSGNSITYSIADFSTVNINNDFEVAVATETAATIGDTVCVDVAIVTPPGDSRIANNQLQYCYAVTNSYDPNMKETYPEYVMPAYNSWFYYTIHFQNTGTAMAHNISLTDTLSSFLDLSTFERIGYSHNNNTRLIGRSLQFNFDNIDLPDSTSNSSGSKGFVLYRIKPKSNLPAGTIIDNKAYIYFDYNPPIITNTSHNTYLASTTGLNEIAANEFNIYPNPTNGMLIISSEIHDAIGVEVYDVMGNMVYEQKNVHYQTQLNLSDLNNGVYFIKLRSNNKIATKKIIKQD